jgi:hypothetical protein
MNEEQAVLDFFSQEENLPLALVAAEHLDSVRLRLNNEFWLVMQKHLDALLAEHGLPWKSALTEDRNNEDCLVGLHLQPQGEQQVFLRPFMEQQFLGDNYRIYHGLIWSTTPDAMQKTQPAVEALRMRLNEAGFKDGDSFLAWQWLPWYPRRKDFLLRFAKNRDELLNEASDMWGHLLFAHNEELHQANLALRPAPHAATIPLEQLRSKLRQS